MPRTCPLPLRRVRRLSPYLLVLLALAACKGVEQAPTSAGPEDVGGTIVIATPSDASTLLPPLAAAITDREVTDLLYDRLAEIGEDLNTVGDKGFRPQLADRWEWAPDSLSITFHLNPRARWHDGRPVRASDVRYSVRLIKDPVLGAPAGPLVGNIDSVGVRDSLTAVAYFKRHVPEQFYDLVYQVVIVPEHILGNTPAAGLKTAEVGRRGIGSGRFRLAKWEAGTRIELVADTTNYRGRAKLDRVIFSITPDYAGAVTRLFSGDADVLEVLRPEHLPRLKGDTVRRAVPYPNLQYVYLALNLVDPKAPTLPHPIFADRAVRRAMSMSVDRRAMLKNVFDSSGRLLHGPFPSVLAVVDTTLPQIPYDTVKAAALLDSAGWLRGPDGVRVRNGRRLEFGILVPNSSAPRIAYAILLQEAFRRIGAVVKVEQTDFPTFVARQGTHTFDAEMAAYATDPSVSGFKQSWSTAGIGKDGPNFSSYSSPVVDAMLDSATLSFDPARTRAYARRAFETIMDDAPGIWLYAPPTMAGMDKRIRTQKLRADGYWSGMADWWIPASQRSARDRIGLRPTP